MQILAQSSGGCMAPTSFSLRASLIGPKKLIEQALLNQMTGLNGVSENASVSLTVIQNLCKILLIKFNNCVNFFFFYILNKQSNITFTYLVQWHFFVLFKCLKSRLTMKFIVKKNKNFYTRNLLHTYAHWHIIILITIHML